MKLPTRVQRIPSEWPIVHLESEVPEFDSLTVSGMVRFPFRLSLADLRTLGPVSRSIPLHCVWGWSRPGSEWTGVSMSEVLALAEVESGFVTIHSASATYSSCLPVADAADGFLTWMRDGRELGPTAGGPLRYLAPARYWAYKGVKWASRIVVHDRFVPGFWESKVADPVGLIPSEVDLP